MGKVYFGNIKSEIGHDYSVEIHHSTNTPTPIEITLSEGGFELDYEGQGNATYDNVIMGSTCDLSVHIQSQTVLDGITAIAESKETDYFLIIYRNGVIFWHGTIVTDQITIPRGSYQGAFSINIKANDRLKLLGNVDFDFGTYSIDGDRERGLELIKQILQKNNEYITALYGVNDKYLLDSIETKAQNQPDGTLYNVSYKRESFLTSFSYSDDFGDEDEYISCREVIKNILQVFNAQILLTNGFYVIRQVENQFGLSTEFNQYTKALTKITGFYTISNGINVQDGQRSCFEALPNYTYQPAIREITSEITEANFNYAENNTVSAISEILTTTDVGDLRYKYAKILVALKDIKTQYVDSGVTYDANDIELFALFWVKNSGGDYFYLKGGAMVSNGTTVPTYNERISHTDIEKNANNSLQVSREIRLPDEDIVEYKLHMFAKTNWYSTVAVRVYAQPNKTQLVYKFSHQEDTQARSKIGIKYSYNSWNTEETAEYKKTREYANNILSANEKLSFNPELNNKYYSGQIYDIHGILAFDNISSKWTSPAFDLVDLGVSATVAAMPLIMAANIYQNNVKTIEGRLLTNGAIYAINSINIDSLRWVFNGGKFVAQYEAWDGQWVKIAKGTINTGTGGTKYNTVDGTFKDHGNRLDHIIATHGNVGDAFLTRVLRDDGRTSNPSGDELKNIGIFYDLAEDAYLYKTTTPFPSPFAVTSDTSEVPFNTTVNIVLSGSYFRADSVVSINKGTLNSYTINSDNNMVLNVTAITVSEAVNTCDVTIDGVTFSALWTYVEVSTTYTPGDGTTEWVRVSANCTTGVRELYKTSGQPVGYNSGASFNLTESNSGKKVEFSYNVGNAPSKSGVPQIMIGLDVSDPDHNYSTIDFAILHNAGQIVIYENGVFKANKGAYSFSDNFVIVRESVGTVKLQKNGSDLHTFTGTSTGSLVMDTSMYNDEGKFYNISMKVYG